MSGITALRARFAPEPELTLSLFGGFQLCRGPRQVGLRNRKGQALIAYLALSPSGHEPRGRICGLLWSESTEEKARASLRQTVHGLRECFAEFGFDGLSIDREQVGLGSLAVDVEAVLSAAAAGEVHPLLLERKRLTESLLAGLEEVDPAFRIWLLVQRQAVHERLEQHLERILATAAKPDQVKSAALALINLDPTHEEACRRLMRAHAEQGETASALKVYKRLWDVLDQEYGTEPSERTQALIVEIKTRELALAPSVPPTAERDRPAASAQVPILTSPAHTLIVMRPFDSRGVEHGLAHLVHGLRHELIAKLVRFRSWSVIDGDAPNGTAGTPHDATRCFPVEATLRQVRDALQLILTIKEQPSGRYVWSETFALDLEQWFETQQQVVRRIAMALNVNVSTERLLANAPRPEISLNAYDRWLRAWDLSRTSWEPQAWSAAVSSFRGVIEEAPQFSPAYSGLAAMKNSEHLSFPGILRDRVRDKEALDLARLAVESDPLDSQAHLALAWALALNGQFEQAELNFGLALDLNENDPWTITSAALGTAFCGDHEKGLALSDQLVRLSPQLSKTQWGYQATTRFICMDLNGCSRAAILADTTISNVLGWHAAALALLGQRDDAKNMAARFVREIREVWAGDIPPTDDAVTAWFLQAFPFRRAADLERLRDGLSRAGLPVVPA